MLIGEILFAPFHDFVAPDVALDERRVRDQSRLALELLHEAARIGQAFPHLGQERTAPAAVLEDHPIHAGPQPAKQVDLVSEFGPLGSRKQRDFGRDALPEMKTGYATATRVLAFLVLPASFGMAAILPTALPLVSGQAFAAAVPAAKDVEVEAFESELEGTNSEVKRVVMLKRNLVDKVRSEPEASSRLLENWIRQGKAAS